MPLEFVLAPDATEHDRAIAQRAALMRAMIEVGADDARLPILVTPGEVFDCARRAMRYEDDPHGWDTARTVKGMMDYIERENAPVPGDCMHRATLVGALLVRAGLGAAIHFQSFDGQRFTHVLALDGAGTAIDPQECLLVGAMLASVRGRTFHVARRRW